MKTFATMFSGGELFGVGAQQAGFRHLWGVEYDDKIASVARSNGFNVMTADVRNLSARELEHPDHLHASPPCPNFSVAKSGGTEQPEDVAMAEAVCRFITEMKPNTFSLENVTAYRKSQSLAKIVTTLQNLGYMIDIQNLNAADFGVPQTRRRLILRASRQGLLRPYPKPVTWVGWYAAIEDILDTLPDTEFAPWQLDRMPKEYRSFLIGQGSWSKPREDGEPAHTITSNNNQIGTKAFLINGANSTNNKLVRESDDPTYTVTANMDKTPQRAFIVNTQESHGRDGEFTVRAEGEPMSTVAAAAGVGRHKAFIMDGQKANRGAELVTIRDGDEPVFTQTSTAAKRPIRAYTGGRVVKMTVQALGRFQTIPDDYKGLTVKINGNGVPCLLARGIMETLL